MSVSLSILAILDEGPAYGSQLRNEFEVRTGGIWPLNVGQVYTTLDRLERDELVKLQPDPGPEGSKVYEITPAGRDRLIRWLTDPLPAKTPSRDELVLKLIMSAARDIAGTESVIQSERRAAIQVLQEYTRLKRDASDEADLGWVFLVDSLIFQTEARVRWLDACEQRLRRSAGRPRAPRMTVPDPSEVTS